MKPINVGLLGIGTVGGGTFTVLRRNQEEITRRAGRAIVLKMIADKDVKKARKLVGKNAIVTANAGYVKELMPHDTSRPAPRPVRAGGARPTGRAATGRRRAPPRRTTRSHRRSPRAGCRS